MSMDLCMDELERLEEDIADGNFRRVKYLDTWDYEYEYSHNDIEIAEISLLKRQMTFSEKMIYLIR